MTTFTAINPAELPQFEGSFWASAWDTWYSYSDRACADTAKAYRWYTKTFFGDEAQHVYTTLGEALGHLMIATILVGQITRKHYQAWVDAEVAACLPAEPQPEPATEADPFAAEVNPHYPAVAQPKEPSIRELKQMASEAKVKGYSTMTKVKLMEVLQGMDCWALSEDCLA